MQRGAIAHRFHCDKDTTFTTELCNDITNTFRSGAIATSVAHEQNNECITGEGRSVGPTDKPGGLRRWIIAGHEFARVVKEFQVADGHRGWRVDARTPSRADTKCAESLCQSCEISCWCDGRAWQPLCGEQYGSGGSARNQCT